MRLRYQYGLFIILLHIVLAVLLYYVFEEDKRYFVLSEVGIIISLWISYRIYNAIVKPIDFMKTGINAIKDEDFNVKFLETGSEDMNDLIQVFNIMLDKLGEEKVRTQEQAYFLENLINVSPIGMIILDYDDNVSDINPRARQFLKLGRYQHIDKLEELEHPLIPLIRNIEIGESKVLTYDGVNKFKCQTNMVIHRGFNRKFIMIEELSKELLASEKAAYGKVIRMMAHEVNNSMGAVNSILQSVVDFAFDGSTEDDKEYASSLIIAKERNEELALFMKKFADVIRLPEPVRVMSDLAVLVHRSARTMRPTASDQNIDIIIEGPEEGVMLMIDKTLINQVIVNIIKNAIESIGKNGVITVSIDEGWPQLVISDNGPGIPDEVQPMLFSPFYSTKPTGQGIGLILIRDILVNHEANFSLQTDKESGLTEFKISF